MIIPWEQPMTPPAPPGPEELHLWLINLDSPEAVEQARASLSQIEQERSTGMPLEDARRRFILSRSAMRTILGDYLSAPASELEFIYGEKGKPSLNAPLQFNLTHATNLALLAVTTDHQVGIDMEPLIFRKGLPAIARRVFSQHTNESLDKLDGERYTELFYQHWTALEAKVKAVGKGIFSELEPENSITYQHFKPLDGWIAAVAMEEKLPATERWSTFHFSFENMALDKKREANPDKG